MSLFRKLLIAPFGAITLMLLFALVGNSALDQQSSALDDMFGNRFESYEIASIDQKSSRI